MFERMLNKMVQPTFEEMIDYAGESGALWTELDHYLQTELSAVRLIRFPYGNKYGWSAKYSQKSKHICDIFAENGAFTAHFRMADRAVETIYKQLDDYAKDLWEKKYPCSGGGWLHFRVTTNEQLAMLQMMICAKMTIRG